MGGTQHTNGNNNTRAYCVLQLALGNIGTSGGGTNIFRGHDNVQGATDLGVLSHTLPGYYGLKTGSWKHWARVWDVDYDYLKAASPAKGKLMENKGIPVSRWIDGVLEDKDNMDQPDNVRAMVFWGHAPNSQTRLPDMKKAMEKLDMLVVIDPYPTMSAVMHDRKDGVYLLPAATQFETYGSVTASNRSIQWRDKVVDPLFESLPDHEIMYKFAKKLGFADEMFKNIKVNGNEPVIEDITREFNKGMWTIGYTGQSPERLKLHMANQHTFDKTTLQAVGGPADGDYYGCRGRAGARRRWGIPARRTSTTRRSRWPRAASDLPRPLRRRAGRRQPAGRRLLSGRLGDPGRLSRVHHGHAEEARLGRRPDRRRARGHRGGRRRQDQLEDRPFRRHPAGRHQARLRAFRQRQGAHCGVDLPGSGAAAPRAALHAAARSGGRLSDLRGPQDVSPADALRLDPGEGLLEGLPDHPHLRPSGRIRGRRRRDPVQPVAGRAAAGHVRRDQSRSTPTTAASRTARWSGCMAPRAARSRSWPWSPSGSGAGVAFMPFHFGGHFQGEDLRHKYPAGADPYVLGEASNTAQTYGYDSVTKMQETKATLCRIEPA